jgi:diaminohydroxyphosphoribosylaminopyrimidine deaminase/5-amino-6-(5-phosphoribosylamino)uracil reductase
MVRALALAQRGRTSTHPNPRVGAVLVKDGEVVGEGLHERAGGPHAEVNAFKDAGARARGADLYVTLEPCSHTGRTGPCTEAVIAAGVKRVFAAMQDPNPKVAGKGFAKLREAGIEVQEGLMEAEAEELNRGYLSRMTRGKPFVTLKLAMSLDGRTAMASGESRWITGDEARADAHRRRAEAGAVMTSSATALADDPELTARDFPTERQPDRILLDTTLRTPATARLWQPGARRIALTVRPSSDYLDALRLAGVEVALVGASADRHVDLASALVTLGRMDINEVFVECGPRLAGALLTGGHVDELVLYVAPSFLGHEARALANLPGVKSLAERLRYRFRDVAMIGSDLRITAIPERL